MRLKNNNKTESVLIFPCSGASDVGELADRAARRMTRSGLGKIYCLAAIGGKLQQYIDETKATKDIIIIDGCSNVCANKTLSTIGVSGYEFNLEKMGFQKGDSPATGKNIDKVVSLVQTRIQR
jgi:uncharacterized metal-binding protein